MTIRARQRTEWPPAWDWLKDNLGRIRDLAGGQDSPIAQPVVGGAAFAMMAVLVLVWLIALLPLTVWQLCRSLVLRRG